MNWQKILGITTSGTSNDDLEKGTLYHELEQLFSDLPEEEIRFIAGFAGLLGRVALSDMRLEPEEVSKIREILNTRTSLTPERIDRILELIRLQADQLFGSENIYYVRLINDTADRSRKMEVLDALFAVAAANDSITTEEEAELRLIADSLGLYHSEYIRVRLRYRDQLDVLKKSPPRGQ